jgi:RNA polymerase sigma-70 factor (ECF subfamily)
MDDGRLVEILQQIAGGDADAVGAFYDATSSRVYGLALQITRAADEAEEVVSDAYLQVWRQAARLDPQRGSPLAWLLMITRSRALDRLRRRDEARPVADVPEPADPPAGGNAETQLLASESESAVQAALVGLSAAQQRMVQLAFYRGLSHPEIAAETGLPLGTVKSHLRRALQALAKALGPGEGGEQ